MDALRKLSRDAASAGAVNLEDLSKHVEDFSALVADSAFQESLKLCVAQDPRLGTLELLDSAE